MNPIFASDLAFMMADFGQAVAWGGFSTTGNLTVATEDLVSQDGFAIVRGETLSLVYRRTDLPGLKRREILTIDSVPYLVRHIDLAGDGLQATAYLESA